jgi:thymidine kinase
MTPKEKANELFNKYFLLHQSATDEKGNWNISILNKGLAKKCALITVDECLQFEKSIVQQIDEISKEAFKLFVCEAKFWHSVKEEIENL